MGINYKVTCFLRSCGALFQSKFGAIILRTEQSYIYIYVSCFIVHNELCVLSGVVIETLYNYCYTKRKKLNKAWKNVVF